MVVPSKLRSAEQILMKIKSYILHLLYMVHADFYSESWIWNCLLKIQLAISRIIVPILLPFCTHYSMHFACEIKIRPCNSEFRFLLLILPFPVLHSFGAFRGVILNIISWHGGFHHNHLRTDTCLMFLWNGKK